MKDFYERHKNIVLFAAIFASLVLIYVVFFRGSSTPEGTTEVGTLRVTEISEGTGVGDQLVAMLIKLQSLKLDTKVFKDPAFRSLNDFGREIPPEPVGRINPFAPIGVE